MPRLSLILALLLVAGCAKQDPSPHAEKPVKAPIAVEVSAAAPGDIQRALTLSGDIRAARETPVSARVGGRLETLLVDEGTRVQAGQALARIDDTDLKLQLLQAEAQLAAAQANRASSATNLATTTDNLKRLQQLHGEGGVSDQQLIQTRGQAQAAEAGVRAAEAQIAQARAAIALAKSQLSYTTITAPFAGVVTQKQAEIGTMLQPMAPVFTVASVKDLEVKVPVGQAFLGGVHPGQSASFNVPTYPGRSFSARVKEVAPTVDVGTRTATVTLAIPNEEGLLAPGMFARVNLPTASREDVVVVPEAAVVSNGEREFVFVVAAGTAERREVKTGLREDQRVELTAGVEPGDAIVTLGQGMLEDGDTVKVVNDGKEAIQ